MAADNKSLGRFDLTGILPARRGVPQIGVTFEIDNNGILKVTAKDQGTGKDQSIVIQPSGGLTKDEINKMVNQAEQMKEQDKKKREAVDVRNNLDSTIHNAQSSLTEHGSKVSQEIREELLRALEQARNQMKVEDVNVLNEELRKLNDVVYKFGAAVTQSAQQGQQQQQSEQKPEGENNDQNKENKN